MAWFEAWKISDKHLVSHGVWLEVSTWSPAHLWRPLHVRVEVILNSLHHHLDGLQFRLSSIRDGCASTSFCLTDWAHIQRRWQWPGVHTAACTWPAPTILPSLSCARWCMSSGLRWLSLAWCQGKAFLCSFHDDGKGGSRVFHGQLLSITRTSTVVGSVADFAPIL